MKNEFINQVKGCYIPSIEAEEIFDMSVRGLENIMKYEYKGMISYSLELIKLRSYKRLFAEKEITKNGKVKYMSDAIINIKFKNKIKDGNEITSTVRDYTNLMSILNKQLESLEKKISNIEGDIKSSKNKREIEKLHKTLNYFRNKVNLVKDHIERIEADKENDIYTAKKAHELREYLYVNGITFKGRHYKFYKRTASKSRTAQTLFILDELYEPMKEWSHIGLNLEGKIDVASLLAYESLVLSSLEETITINPYNIFITEDKFSVFKRPAIEVGNDLKAVSKDQSEIENNIWDGQGLIDISLMESIGRGNKGMILTRQHFWKSCLFNSNIQLFLQHKHAELINPESKNYDPTIPTDYNKWKLPDAFGNKMLALDIMVVSTPSSCKFLKYAEKGKEKEAYANWKKRIQKEKDKNLRNTFGICKSEKPSKFNDYSYTSYQMINTLDADINDIKKLSEYEVDFVKDLQGRKIDKDKFEEQPFIDYLVANKQLTNAYELLYEMYNINPEVVRAQFFRDYRKEQIRNYRTKIKGGKLRQLADYLTVCSNPFELLLSVVGQFNEVKSHTLQGNQVYTTLCDTSKSYMIARNPHNAMNNWFEVHNIENELINTYFNFKDAPNIICISSIDCEILTRCNGMDMDSDSVLLFRGECMNDIIKKTLSNRNYPVILNTIKPKPNPVELTTKNISTIDEKTAKSQRWIGQITNACQFQVSLLWDIQNDEKYSGDKDEAIKEITESIAVAVVLSNVAIDYSKKVVEVDVDKALRKINSSKVTKVEVEAENKKGKVVKKLASRKKPKFWKYVTSSNAERDEYSCPMDLLIGHIHDIEQANYRKNLSLRELLIDLSENEMKKADEQQIRDIIELVREFDRKLKKINSQQDDKKCQERQVSLEDAYNELDERISKKGIRKATMYKILVQISDSYDKKQTKKMKTNNLSGIVVHLMNTLFRNHRTTFLNLLKK